MKFSIVSLSLAVCIVACLLSGSDSCAGFKKRRAKQCATTSSPAAQPDCIETQEVGGKGVASKDVIKEASKEVTGGQSDHLIIHIRFSHRLTAEQSRKLLSMAAQPKKVSKASALDEYKFSDVHVKNDQKSVTVTLACDACSLNPVKRDFLESQIMDTANSLVSPNTAKTVHFADSDEDEMDHVAVVRSVETKAKAALMIPEASVAAPSSDRKQYTLGVKLDAVPKESQVTKLGTQLKQLDPQKFTAYGFKNFQVENFHYSKQCGCLKLTMSYNGIPLNEQKKISMREYIRNIVKSSFGTIKVTDVEVSR